MRRAFLAAFAAAIPLLAVCAGLNGAAAQQSVPNPLRPKAEDARPAEEAPARTRRPRAAQDSASDKPAEAAKPRRERSAKQKQQDDMMRACGAEWRAEKAALQAKGENWRSFLKTCRAKKRAEQPV